MKALTVHQPGAWAIVAGYKVVENRTRPLVNRMVGQRILIHAGKTFYLPNHEWMVNDLGLEPVDVRSAIVGEATLMASVHRNELRAGRQPKWEWCMDDTPMEALLLWSSWDAGGGPHNPWCWLLGQPLMYPEPIRPVSGQQGFWNYEAGAARPAKRGRRRVAATGRTQ